MIATHTNRGGRPLAVGLAWLAATVVGSASAAEFAGWQGMRVIPLDGRAERLAVADLGNDGRDDVIVVNPRQARIDVYRWLSPAERTRADATDPERPNELPLAPEWSHGEVPIDELPQGNAIASEHDDFLRAVATRGRPVVDAASGLEALDVALRVVESLTIVRLDGVVPSTPENDRLVGPPRRRAA